MNFLDLSKRLRQEAGYSGTGPASVQGQTGEAKRIVDWINEAWVQIQEMRSDWRFMLKTFSVTLNSGDSTVQVASDVKRIKSDDRRSIVLTRADGSKSFPSLMRPEDMRQLKRIETDFPSYPHYISVDSSGLMTVAPSCAETVTIEGDYYRRPARMSANTDVPVLPEEYHMGIVWKALMLSGAYDESGNAYQHANTEWNRYLADINRTELPLMRIGGPIA